MYRQYDAELDEENVMEPQSNAGMYGQMPYDGTQQFGQQSMPWQGMEDMEGMQGMQGIPTQIGGRPMLCYPMMYWNQMGQDEAQENPDMYRQQGMQYYNRPRPNYPRPRRRRRRRRPYVNIYPFFFPYYYPNNQYYYDEDDYSYDHDF